MSSPDASAEYRPRDTRPPCQRAFDASEGRYVAARELDGPEDKPSAALLDPARGITRREFVEWMGLAAAGMAAGPLVYAEPQVEQALLLRPGITPQPLPVVDLSFTLNGSRQSIQVEPRTSLLDLLREHLGLAGTRKGCNQGACGACTIHLDGDRINSCLTLAVQVEGREVRTIEGLADADGLHPVQRAFIEHDGFQCGYCTSGQIMSAVALIAEADAGLPSHATPDVATPPTRFATLSDDEIRERMSGNLCRCGAYVGMLAAIQSVQTT